MARSAWMYPQLTNRFCSSSVNLLSLVLTRPRVSGHPSAMTNGLPAEYRVGSVLIIQRAPLLRPPVRSFINAVIRSALVCSSAAPRGRMALLTQNFHFDIVSTCSGLLPFDTRMSFISLRGWNPRLS